MVPVFSFFNWGGGLLDPNSMKEMLSHERVFPSSLWSKAVTLFGKKEKKKRHGLEQRLWICLYEPALSPAFCYISVYQVWTNCSTGASETIPGPSSKTLQMALATWLLGFVQPWVTATLFPVMNWWHCTDFGRRRLYTPGLFSRREVFSCHSVFYLYFMCVCLVCNCFWFSLNKLQLPSLQGILSKIGHSIKIATSNLWAFIFL